MAIVQPMKRWQQFFVAGILFLVALFGVLAIADQWMIIKSGVESCPAKFPMWIGCVLANHENLSGSLITAGGALFAAWVAWHAVMDQIESDKALARNAERPIVHGGPGWRQVDPNDRHKQTGIIFTGQNTGKTTAFPKEICWGACTEDEWSTVGKNWPQIDTAKREKWEHPLPPNMPNDKLIGAEFTPIPDDGKKYVCYGTIVYTDVYGKRHTTSWKHSVVHDGKTLKTVALEGAYSSEWDRPGESQL